MKWVCLLIGIIFFGFCLSTQVWAFGVAPAALDLIGGRGEILEQTFTLVNQETKDTTFYFETLKIEAKNESGTPRFIPADKDHSDLPNWITLSTKKLVVPANSFVEVPFTISIPADIQSQSYYATITVSDSELVAIVSEPTFLTKTAILIFLTVEGTNIEKAGLLDLVVSQKWNDRLFGTITYRIQNQGNVYLQPQGEITFKDIFGRTLSTEDVNTAKSRVLPETTRTFEIKFGNKGYWNNLLIGPVNAELSLEYGNEGQKIITETTFWVIPWQLFLLIIGGAIVVVGIKLSFKTKNK